MMLELLIEILAILAITWIASMFYIRAYFKELEKRIDDR